MAQGKIIMTNFGFDNQNKRVVFHSLSPHGNTRKSLGELEKAVETLACGWFLVISVSGILFLFLNLIEGSSLDLVSFCFPVEPVYITRRDQN